MKKDKKNKNCATCDKICTAISRFFFIKTIFSEMLVVSYFVLSFYKMYMYITNAH